MKREKKYLLISAIIAILYIPFDIFVLSKIYANMYKAMDITVNSDLSSTIIGYSIYSIGIIYFLILSLNKKIDLNNHRKGILVWSILLFIFDIASGILGFIVYGSLDKSQRKEKRELPEIEYKEFTNKYICLAAFVICMVLMFVVSKYISGFLQLILLYLTMFILMISVFAKQLKHDFKIFKEYFKEYFSLILKTWLKSLVVLMIIGIIIQLFTNTIQSNNQETLQKMFNVYPLFVAFLAMIYAPFTEELLFRGVFRKFIKSKYLFIIISGVAFGLLHVIDDSKTLAEFSYIIVYSSLGMFLASLYYKTNNLFSNILFHFMQNTLGIVGMLLLYFLK